MSLYLTRWAEGKELCGFYHAADKMALFKLIDEETDPCCMECLLISGYAEFGLEIFTSGAIPRPDIPKGMSEEEQEAADEVTWLNIERIDPTHHFFDLINDTEITEDSKWKPVMLDDKEYAALYHTGPKKDG